MLIPERMGLGYQLKSTTCVHWSERLESNIPVWRGRCERERQVNILYLYFFMFSAVFFPFVDTILNSDRIRRGRTTPYKIQGRTTVCVGISFTLGWELNLNHSYPTSSTLQQVARTRCYLLTRWRNSLISAKQQLFVRRQARQFLWASKVELQLSSTYLYSGPSE